jgi:hypothetical protein
MHCDEAVYLSKKKKYRYNGYRIIPGRKRNKRERDDNDAKDRSIVRIMKEGIVA